MYKQFSLVLIVRLEVDKPWKEVSGGIKTGETINLPGLSQSSMADSPPKKRMGGGGESGGGGGRGGRGNASTASSIQ